MVRRSVRARFRRVYWVPPDPKPVSPTIFATNHHGWFDGYLMFHALTKLEARFLDWVQEYDSFPLFGKVGCLPFPADRPEARAATVRKTIRLMREERRNLLLFAEGILHRPPDLLEFGKALELVAAKVPGVSVTPVAIRYDFAMNERPEAWIQFAGPVPLGPDLSSRTRQAVQDLLQDTDRRLRESPGDFEVLVEGTLDVNERMKFPGKR